MKSRFVGLAAAAALMGAGGHAYAATVVIDTFDTEQRVWDEPGTYPVGSEIFADEAIGDHRDLYVETDGAAVADTELEVEGGRANFNNDDQVTGRGWITYDGDDNAPGPNEVATSGLGGVDLFDGPIGAAFIFDVISADHQIYIKISAWDLAGRMVTYDETLPEGGGSPAVPFSLFSGDADFNWNQVGALQFFAQSGPDSDVPSLDGSISSIVVDTGVIPLPATGLLLLGGLGGLSAFAARRRKS